MILNRVLPLVVFYCSVLGENSSCSTCYETDRAQHRSGENAYNRRPPGRDKTCLENFADCISVLCNPADFPNYFVCWSTTA